jgi:hypothetical protein
MINRNIKCKSVLNDFFRNTNYYINPYSVMQPPGGFLEFLNIIHFINIISFIA